MQKIYFFSRFSSQSQEQTINFKTGRAAVRQQNRDRVLQDFFLAQAAIVQGGSTTVAFSALTCYLDSASAVVPRPPVS